MSLEIVGIVLGAIPLVVHAYSRSISIIKTLTARQEFLSQLNKFRSNLDSQRVIFQTNAIILQSVITKQELKEFDTQCGGLGQVRPGPNVEVEEDHANKADHLKDLLQCCKNTLEQIRQSLYTLSTKLGALVRDECEDTVSSTSCPLPYSRPDSWPTFSLSGHCIYATLMYKFLPLIKSTLMPKVIQ